MEDKRTAKDREETVQRLRRNPDEEDVLAFRLVCASDLDDLINDAEYLEKQSNLLQREVERLRQEMEQLKSTNRHKRLAEMYWEQQNRTTLLS